MMVNKLKTATLGWYRENEIKPPSRLTEEDGEQPDGAER